MPQRSISDLIQRYGDVLASFFNHLSDMIFLLKVEEGPRFRYVMMNPAAMRAASLTEEAYGKCIEDVYPEEMAAFLNNKYYKAVVSREPITFIHSGEVVGESILTPIFNEAGECTHVFSVTRDVTEQKKLEQQLEFMAYHDMLTGLPNRRLLMDRLQQAISKAKRLEHSIAVLYLDCDHFKLINDTWGHDVGDEFLQILAKRLKSCVRDMDTVARIGGDEFVIVLTPIHSPEEAVRVAQRVLDSLQQPWQMKQQQFSLSTSIGISLFPFDGEDSSSLLKNADRALYLAKADGRSQYRFYSNISTATSRNEAKQQ
jgi:diguanylate cyclase (GGDEF)-like protein